VPPGESAKVKNKGITSPEKLCRRSPGGMGKMRPTYQNTNTD